MSAPAEPIAGDSIPRPGWRRSAACRGTDPEAWDASTDNDTGTRGKNRRRAEPWQVFMCAGCPVEIDCLAEAYVLGDREVIRGRLVLSAQPRRNRDVLADALGRLGVDVAP